MLRFALAGCGRISGNHIEALSRLEGVRIVGCCDVVEERARETAAKAGCAAWTDYGRMLAECEADVVSLCTPSGLHPAQAMAAARAGKHVVSEKPFGVRIAEADAALRVCEAEGVRLFVVKQNRFNKTIALLRSALEKNRFGRLTLVQSNVFWQRPQDYYEAARWRGTWEYDGGCLMNQASHYVDLVQWLGGGVESVQAFGATLGRRIEAEDAIVVNLRFRSGALGHISATVLAYPKNIEGSLTVLGERGSVRIGGFALNRVEQWEFADEDPMDDAARSCGNEPPNVYGFGHLPYYEHVAEVLLGEAAPLVDGNEGRKSLALICAAYESALNGGATVRFDPRREGAR